MSPGTPQTVAVVGGGIAGLSAAWELVRAEPAVRVIVFEGDGRLGGKLRTGTFGGREVDLGPDAFVARRPEALALCAELGLTEDLVAPGVRGASVWARGRLRPLPDGLALGVPTRFGPLLRSGICSPAGLARPALDLLWPARGTPGRGASGPGSPGGETESDLAVGGVVRRRMGAQVTSRLAGPLIGGIHAGNVDLMSAAAVFPALLEADRQRGSLMRALAATLPARATTGETPVFLTLRGGMGRLVDVLSRALVERGVELRTGTTVGELGRLGPADDGPWVVGTDPVGGAGGGAGPEADGIVVAVPAPAAAHLLRPHDGALADALETVTYASVAIITFRFSAEAVGHPLDGSGFLVPRGEGAAPDPLVTACTWLTSKWPELARPGDVLIRASVGRQGDDRHTSMSDDQLGRHCLDELGPMIDIRRPPDEVLVTRWPDAFPQYTVGHLSRVAAMEASAAGLPRLALAGAALHGVGIPACIGSGRRAARAVLR